MKKFTNKGFTLIELLIVIAVIAILAAIVFVALDPLTRFQDARDSRRFSDVASIASAIRVDQVDNGGAYLWAISNVASTATGSPFMIQGVTSTSTTGASVTCDQTIVSTSSTVPRQYVNLQGLSDEGYLGAIPISPNGDGNWTSALNSGYYIVFNANRSITIGACESENTASISVTR